ncbi:hypothetical protein DFO47_10571 [Arthrobacter sp. AG258]|uniref:hypothetical protein n=1 Tax=Arthrobacter sp. AG258 TaxID=2183899 RepID=UPI00105CEA91|nr:hypothetical protein [Arthrobacter sp. AG258]TDT79275.1 hypothetical protein DFO47_10571 [Arthrobacter sp. AG258]
MTRRGHTRIAPAALRHTLEAVAAGAYGVPRDDVSAALRDDAGKLGVDLQMRLPVPPLLAAAPAGREQHSTFEQANIARLRIAFAGRRITGMDIGRINIRLTAAPRAAKAARTDRARKQDGRQP